MWHGTVTSVGSGLGLSGGPITTSGSLAIDANVVPQLGLPWLPMLLQG